jgi:hypothetical protein
MNRFVLSFVSSLVLTALCGACQSNPSPAVNGPTKTSILSSHDSSATEASAYRQTLSAYGTARVEQAATNTVAALETAQVEELTPVPSITPTRIRPPVPTATQVTLAPVLDLPEWLGEEGREILHIQGVDAERNLVHIFLNAATGETYTLLSPGFAPAYFWEEPRILGFISRDAFHLFFLDLKTGHYIQSDVSTETIKLVGDIGFQEYVFRKESDGERVLVPSNQANSISLYGNYEYLLTLETGELTTRVRDRYSGELVFETNGQDGRWDLEAQWSPLNNRQLAIVQGTGDTDYPFYVSSQRLEIVDVLTRSTVMRFEGDFGKIQWSADGGRILFLGSIAYNQRVGGYFKGSPCFLHLVDGSIECMPSIPLHHFQGRSEVEGLLKVRWGTNERYIYYLVYQSEGVNESGYVCQYDLLNGEIICPDFDFASFENFLTVWYETSPQEDYLFLYLRQVGTGPEGPCKYAVASIDSSVGYVIPELDRGIEEGAACLDASWLPTNP